MSGSATQDIDSDTDNYPTYRVETQLVATLITGDNLRKAIEQDGFIKDGIASCVEGAKYDFRMSPSVLKSSFGQPVNLDKLPEQDRAKIRVEPGEVVFVRTIEEIHLPKNIIATLSSKRKLSHQGIIVLGGFCIDPLYKGPLWIGLYNFSSTPFHLQPGKKLIAALFYELSDVELTDFPTPETITEDDFPDELINLIRNYKPVELKSLIENIGDLQKQLDTLTAEVRDDRDWKRDFKESLEAHNRQLGQLIAGLQDEKEARKQEDERIKIKMDSMEEKFRGFWTTLFSSFRIAWVVAALFIGIVATWGIPKLLDLFLSNGTP